MSGLTRRQFGGLAAVAGSGLLSSLAVGVAVAATHRVEIKGFRFRPERLVIKPGDTVQWINRDTAPHTATARNGGWDTKTLKKNQSKSVRFTAAGSQAYFCRFHPKMVGEIIVK